MENNTYQQFLDIRKRHKAGFILLLDPDDLPFAQIAPNVKAAIESGVDAFFIGGSFLIEKNFDAFVKEVKAAAGDHPVILFPGGIQQISAHADAILFLSLISGRNPEHLIGNQAMAAPTIWKMQLETISCGYMLIESGGLTSAEFVSNSLPIPRQKPKIALAHALAGQYIGMKVIYLEAGSGAKHSVPEEMIATVSRYIDIPVIVGGGIRSPEAAAAKVTAGADYIVVGNFFEKAGSYEQMQAFARAIHQP